jgi:uncharacterized membrane protein
MEIWEIHPALVHFPIAFFFGGVLLGLYAWRRREDLARIATGLLLAGVVTGALTALAGVLAFYTVPSSHTEEAHRLILWHIGLAVTQFVLFTVAAIVRWRRQPATPSSLTRMLGLIAAVILLAASALGGRTVYHGGMGIEPGIMASHLREHSHGGGQTHQGGDSSQTEGHEH